MIIRLTYLILMGILVSRIGAAQTVVINEMLAANVLTLGDEAGEFDDWIELYNSSGQTIVLAGYYLTDDPANLTQWYVPAYSEIPAHGYLLLWADNDSEQGTLHCNFRLSSESGRILLVSPDGLTIVDSISYNQQKTDISWGRFPDGQSSGYYFLKPTPGLPNTMGYLSFIPKPVTNQVSGFYTAPFTVTLNKIYETDTIRYTLDGSDPDEFSSVYMTPLALNQTAVMKARSFRDSAAISDIVVKTYFINTIHKLPVLSVATNPDNLFDPDIGIYIHYRGSGRTWERLTNLQYLKNEILHFQLQAGIRIQGNSSVVMPKKSFRLFFRDGFGNDSLNYPLFDHTNVHTFKNLVLRAGYDEDITTTYGTLIRDPVITELWRRMGYITSHSKFIILYLNNDFWGIYDTRESVNEHFIRDYLHISDLDLIRYRYSDWEIKFGSGYAWQDAIDFFVNSDLTSDSAFAEANRVIDIDNYTSLHALMHFTQYRSWYYGAYAFKGTQPGDRWQWTIWDMDRAYTDITWNGFDHYHDPQDPFWNNNFIRKLLQNDKYKQYFINRHLDLYNTLFRPENVLPVVDSLAGEIAPEIPMEASRWGSTVSKWETNIEYLRRFVRQRPDTVLKQMTAYFDLDTAITVTVDGTSNEGYIQINTIDIKDFPWSGKYYPEIPIRVKAVARKGFMFAEWSDPALQNTAEIDIFPWEGLHLEAKFSISVQGESRINQKSGSIIISQNYPNPFNQETTFKFSLSNAGKVTLSIFNLLGQKIKKIINDRTYTAGEYYIRYNTGNLASGIYIYKLEVENNDGTIYSKINKMILLK